MPSEKRLLSLVGKIYDAAADASLWPAFLEPFSDAVHGGQTVLLYYDAGNARTDISPAIRSDSVFLGRYAAYYCKVNPWMVWASRRNLVGPESISTSEERLPFSELEKTEFYNDYLLPQDTVHQFGCIFGKTERWMSALACLRGRKKGPFGAAEIQLLRVLYPHLERAVQFHQKIAQLEGKQRVCMDAIDHLPTGIILLDGRGELVLLNRAAHRILEQNDGLTAAKHGLAASFPGRTKRLQSMIASAAQTARGEGFSAGGAIGIPRPSGKRNFAVTVMPASINAFPGDVSLASVVVFLSDPEERAHPAEALFAETYDLTAAESRLAERLMQGETLVGAARRLGVSHNTVRTHLQRIYAKTETSHQGDLIRLLLAGAAHLCS
jgi:DNA-binding CsgD family transcriptional regulator